jgi:hypothetical protein
MPMVGSSSWRTGHIGRTRVVVCVNWQQVCVGSAAAGRPIDVWVTEQVLQFYDGDQLLRTQAREHPGQVRKKRASIPGGRPTLKSSVTDQPK